MFASVIALLPFALAATATPLVARQNTNCDGLGVSSTVTRGRFFLAAANITDSGALPTAGVRLALAGAGATSGASSQKISTQESAQGASAATFQLDVGVLQPFGTTSDKVSNAEVHEGDNIRFDQSIFGVQPPTRQWCSVHTNEFIDAPAGGDVLAVNGDIEGFSLCKAGDRENATNDLVWRPKENVFGYVFDTCYPVRVHIILDE